YLILWWAFLGEGPDAFLDLGTPHAVASPLVRRGLVELAAGDLVDRALHAPHGERGVAGEDRCQAVDFLVQRRQRHHGGEIADAQHFRRVDLLRGQEQLPGVVGADPRDVTLDAAPAVVQPDPP